MPTQLIPLLLSILLLLILAVSLYTSRVVLNTLGVEDYGNCIVVGGIVPMFAFHTILMMTSDRRFLSMGAAKVDGNVNGQARGRD